MLILTLISGFLFGAIIQYAGLNRYNVISGLALRENLAVAKAIALAIGLGGIILNLSIFSGFASYHVKPLIAGGIIMGGLIFGTGMAILGYCPGTLAISLGEGSVDALSGIGGGLAAGLVYTVLAPFMKSIAGPDLGTLSLKSLPVSDTFFFILFTATGLIFITASFWLHRIDRNKDRKWIVTGILLAVLNNLVFLKIMFDRPIGASTFYPYAADLLTGLTGNEYFSKIKGPGSWEVIFLSGAFLSGLFLSLIRKDFRFVVLHENWIRHKNSSKISRLTWSFAGGFLLLFGARMAGGCTSGHILSGGMQFALSSIIFGVFTFAGLLLTGKLFYSDTAG